MEAIAVAVVTGIFAIIVARQGKKTNEIHRQVTVNHHSSETPTLLDRFDDLEKLIVDHLDWHLHRDK